MISLLAISVSAPAISQNVNKQYVFLLRDSDSLKYALSDSVKTAYLKGNIVHSPLVIVDGAPFRYNQTQDTVYLPLKWSEIRYLSFLHRDSAPLIYGRKGANGAIIINTVYLK